MYDLPLSSSSCLCCGREKRHTHALAQKPISDKRGEARELSIGHNFDSISLAGGGKRKREGFWLRRRRRKRKMGYGFGGNAEEGRMCGRRHRRRNVISGKEEVDGKRLLLLFFFFPISLLPQSVRPPHKPLIEAKNPFLCRYRKKFFLFSLAFLFLFFF